MASIKKFGIKYYSRVTWYNLSKKRKEKLIPLNTSLKSEAIIRNHELEKVEDFYSEKTRDDYLAFGIPYKCVFMLYGVPGSGKTSAINTIASHFDCDVYVIPISKELTDKFLNLIEKDLYSKSFDPKKLQAEIKEFKKALKKEK